jgi:hypothetical protein
MLETNLLSRPLGTCSRHISAQSWYTVHPYMFSGIVDRHSDSWMIRDGCPSEAVMNH